MPGQSESESKRLERLAKECEQGAARAHPEDIVEIGFWHTQADIYRRHAALEAKLAQGQEKHDGH
jgi:hypothetical protein